MGIHYRALVRIFGTDASVEYLRGMLSKAEMQSPGYQFSIQELANSRTFHTHGIEIRGAASRRRPGFAEVDILALSKIAAGAVIEFLVQAGEHETHQVMKGGQLLYRGTREEVSGGVYELGDPGVEYTITDEVGSRDAFLRALAAMDAKHSWQPV